MHQNIQGHTNWHWAPIWGWISRFLLPFDGPWIQRLLLSQHTKTPTTHVIGVWDFRDIKTYYIVHNVSSAQLRNVNFFTRVDILVKIGIALFLKNKCRKFLSKGWFKDKLHRSWSNIPKYPKTSAFQTMKASRSKNGLIWYFFWNYFTFDQKCPAGKLNKFDPLQRILSKIVPCILITQV